MTDIKDEFLDDLKPFIAKQALKYFDKIEDWVESETEKTSTPFDDVVAGQILTWLKGWLQDFIK